MALITVQRSSSNSSALNSEDRLDLSKSYHIVKSITESFFVVKGAALILHKNECRTSRYLPETVHDIRQHLHAIFGIVRPQDRLTLAIRVETNTCYDHEHVRYIALLSTIDRFDIEEYCLIGVDIIDNVVTVGLVMPIFSDLLMKLDGNGGLKLYSNDKQYTVRPVTVQALWSVFQALNKASKQSRMFNFFPGGISHTWIEIYRAESVQSNYSLLNDWNLSDDVIAYRSESPVHSLNESILIVSKQETNLIIKIRYLLDTKER
ncbi:hypothetical protein GJ496_004192 [Pomphorhynchus laevis]|nr:hypothetical protein GJ496_004192 [Pomphorhynchus laevis]